MTWALSVDSDLSSEGVLVETGSRVARLPILETVILSSIESLRFRRQRGVRRDMVRPGGDLASRQLVSARCPIGLLRTARDVRGGIDKIVHLWPAGT